MSRWFPWSFLVAGGIVLCATVAEPPKKRAGAHRAPMLPRVEAVRVMAAPWINLVADYYWIQTIQAVGSANTVEEYRDIYDFSNLLTDLDPKFRQPYVFSGVTMAVPTGKGKYANVDESVKILEKGLKYFPDNINLRVVLAYTYSAFLKDYRRAATILEAAAKLPDAPKHLGPLATRMLAQAGQFDEALEFTRTIIQTSEDAEVRKEFERREKALELERILNVVDTAVTEFKKRESRLPPDIKSLVSSKLIASVPDDPLGGNIYIDADGRARSTLQPRRLTDFAREE